MRPAPGAWIGVLPRAAVALALVGLASLGASSAQAAEPETADVAGPRLMIVGVVIPDHGTPLAAIEDRSAMQTRLYRLGDSVNGGVVTAIARDRVTIAFGNEVVLLRLAGAAGDLAKQAERVKALAPQPRPTMASSAARDAGFGPYGTIGAIRPASAIVRPGRKETDSGGGTGGTAAGGGAGSTAAGADNAGTALQFTGVLHGGREQPGDQFSAQSLRDLLISVTLTNRAASRQRIELTTPEGGVYQTFSGDALPATQLRVPIGGTWITEHNLFGAWTVRVYLDREPLPIASAGFTLSQ